MKLLAGLGNPGPEYTFSRHNVGWRIIDLIANSWSAPSSSLKFGGQLFGPFLACGQKILLLKPLTYMNRSGQSLGEVMRYYNLQPQDLLLFFDDIDLPNGRLRYRTKGSAGGHNGVKSVIAHLSTDQFARIKVGVGAKPTGSDLADHVLAKPSKEDGQLISNAEVAAVEFAALWLKGTEEGQLTSLINGYRP